MRRDRIVIAQGDLTAETADMIVNTANTGLARKAVGFYTVEIKE